MRPFIKSPRILRTGQPLTLEAIRKAAPAVFAEGPHASRGPRYAYVPTVRPLELLMQNGWGVYEAGQQLARATDKLGYTKHMLRLRKLDVWNTDQVTEGVPEVILMNAHDGTGAYRVEAGFFRFVCMNGMICGKSIAGFKVYHTVGSKTSADVLTASETVVAEKFPQVITAIDRMKVTRLVEDAQQALAARALALRYGSTLPPFPAADLLRVRRDADAGDSLWHVFNRVQENILDGGWETRSTMLGRKSSVKPVERVTAVAGINAGLWDAALALAA